MHLGYIVLKDSKSYSLSFPNAGNYVRAFVKGRKALLNTIKKCKYDQMLDLVRILCNYLERCLIIFYLFHKGFA